MRKLLVVTMWKISLVLLFPLAFPLLLLMEYDEPVDKVWDGWKDLWRMFP